MNGGLTFNYRHPRAIKSRLASRLDKKWLRQTMFVLALVLIISNSLLVIFADNSLGYLVGMPGLIIINVLLWYHGELKKLKPNKELAATTELAEIVDRHTLAKLRTNPTSKDLFEAVEHQSGGQFFSSRYGIGKNFFGELLPDDQSVASLAWQEAYKLSQQLKLKEITSAALIAGLVKTIPNHETYLARLKVDINDVKDGVAWHAYIVGLIEQRSKRKNTGGIGRDLSFGWAPLLNRVGYNITDHVSGGGLLARDIEGHRDVMNQMTHVLSQPGRRNAALVGDVGSGKTTLAYVFAQKLIAEQRSLPENLRYNQVMSLDAATLIANAPGRGQLEELLIRVFNEAIAAKNIIIFLDEAQLFLKDATGSVDLSNILLPVIESGSLRLILSLTPQEWLRLSQENPHLAQLINRIVVKPLDESDTYKVMQDQVLILENRFNVVYMQQSLKEAYRLSDRFIHEQVLPGKAIKLLEAASGFTEQKVFVSAQSVQQAIEKTFDVKVQTADTQEEKTALLNLEEKIHKRMINQVRAVKLVSDALRRARAGVRNENKPIGTFLFLGPTGVGKTELSKSLADAYFGGENRMVRIDLNEYSRPSDTSRIISTAAQDPYSLCAQITKQPFSVVLLDEIEKAHPNVLNLLLQMLDEGILRDAQNQPVSFKDAIIIATSNAGADRIRTHIEHGEKLEDFEDEFVNELINANIFRPEFLNRFDETVLFRPLNQEELLQVVDLLLASINKVLAGRKVSITLSDDAKKVLAEAGYDPRLGARPLRRVMQRAVENIVAQSLLSGRVSAGDSLHLEAEELKNALNQRS